MAEDIIVKFQGDVAGLTKSLNDVKKQLADLQAQAGKPLPVGGKTLPATIKATKREFDGLGNSINQLSRELPAFTVSAQTGFLALSNNLPILFDQLGSIRSQNKLLASEGKATVSVLGSLRAAIFSLSTVLSLGVTALVLYGGEIFKWIKGLFGAKEATEAAILAQEQYNKVLKEGQQILASDKSLEQRVATIRFLNERQTEDLRKEIEKQLQALQDREQKAIAIINNSKELTKFRELQAKVTEEQKKGINERDALGFINLKSELDLAERKVKDRFKKETGLTDVLLEEEQNRLIGLLSSLDKEVIANKSKDKKRVDSVKESNIQILGFYERLNAEIAELEERVRIGVALGFVSPEDLEAYKQARERLALLNKEFDFLVNGARKVKGVLEEELRPVIKGLLVDDSGSKPKTLTEILLGSQKEIDTLFQVINNVNTAFNNIAQTQINSLEDVKEHRIKTLDEQLKKGIVNEEQYAKAKLEIETKTDGEIKKLRLEQAEREKLVAVFEATIKGGLAILEAIASGNPLLIAATTLLVGSQIAAIQTAPLPQFGEGGEIKVGKRHSQGGAIIEAEIGEYVNTRASTAKYKEELEAANNLSLDTLISRKYVIPALQRQKEVIKQQVLNNFHDGNILNEHREDRKLYREMIGLLKTRKTSNIRFRNV